MENMEKKECVPSVVDDVIITWEGNLRRLRIAEGARVHHSILMPFGWRFGLPVYCGIGIERRGKVKVVKWLRHDGGYYTIPQMEVGEYLLVPFTYYCDRYKDRCKHYRLRIRLMGIVEENGKKWYDFFERGYIVVRGSKRAETVEIDMRLEKKREYISRAVFDEIAKVRCEYIYVVRDFRERILVECDENGYNRDMFKVGDEVYIRCHDGYERRYEVLGNGEYYFRMVHWP